MPPTNKRSKHLEYYIAHDLIRKQKNIASKRTKERRRGVWAAMEDILKENSEILINKTFQVQTLKDNKLVLIVHPQEW